MPQNISLSTAAEMTSDYRDQKTNILKVGVAADVLPICETFDRDVFDTVLAKSGCVGIRAYLAMDSNNKIKFVFVGVNDQDEDLLPSGHSPNSDDIIEEGQRCPPICPPGSPLNNF